MSNYAVINISRSSLMSLMGLWGNELSDYIRDVSEKEIESLAEDLRAALMADDSFRELLSNNARRVVQQALNEKELGPEDDE